MLLLLLAAAVYCCDCHTFVDHTFVVVCFCFEILKNEYNLAIFGQLDQWSMTLFDGKLMRFFNFLFIFFGSSKSIFSAFMHIIFILHSACFLRGDVRLLIPIDVVRCQFIWIVCLIACLFWFCVRLNVFRSSFVFHCFFFLSFTQFFAHKYVSCLCGWVQLW